MCSGLSMGSFDLFETLETKLSCSALVHTAQAAVVDDDTAPDPEDDPGDLPPTTGPIVYPPTNPDMGPVGPGMHLIHA